MDVGGNREHWLRRTRRVGWVQLAVALVLFVGAIVLTNALANRQDWLNRHGIMTEAEVLGVSCRYGGHCSPAALLRFATADGATEQASVWLNEGTPVRPGTLLAIEYDPAHPSHVQPADHGLQSLPPTELFSVLGLVFAFVLFGTALRRFHVEHRSRQLLRTPGRTVRGHLGLPGRSRWFALTPEDGTTLPVSGLRCGFSALSWATDQPVTVYGDTQPRRRIVIEDPSSGDLFLGRTRRPKPAT